jgi:hypothetical protein
MPLLWSTKAGNHLINVRQCSSSPDIRGYCYFVYSFGCQLNWPERVATQRFRGHLIFQREFIPDRELIMSKGKRILLLIVGLYLGALGFAWIWFHPYFVSERVREHIALGANVPDVEKTFQVKAYYFPGSAYCGKAGPANVTRIAIDEMGRVPLLPLPKAVVTTTLFCFDSNDKLVATRTERWFDEL